MRRRFFPKRLIISLCLLFFTIFSTQAQSTNVPITSTNAAQISQLSHIGNGVPRVMVFSPDGSRLAIATTLGVWMMDGESQAGEQCDVFKEPIGGRCRLYEDQGGALSIVFSPDGSLVASGGDDNSVMVWEVGSGGAVARLENHLYGVVALAWSADGKWLASSDVGGLVRVWDTSDWSEAHVLQTNFGPQILTFDPTATQLTVETSGLHAIWNIADNKLISQEKGGTGKIQFESVESANAGNLHASYDDEKAQIQLGENGRLTNTLTDFYGQLEDVFFTADGRVGASKIHPIFAWSLTNGQLDMKEAPPVVSPDGTLRAIIGNDEVIRLRDNKTGAVLAILHGPIRAVTDVAFSPDGKLLVSSSADGTIQVWDATVLTRDSAPIVTLTGHNGGVTSVAFNADGTLIASSGFDGTIRLWGIKS